MDRPFSCSLAACSQGTVCLEKQVIAIVYRWREQLTMCIDFPAGKQVQRQPQPHRSGGGCLRHWAPTVPKNRGVSLVPVSIQKSAFSELSVRDSRGEKGGARDPVCGFETSFHILPAQQDLVECGVGDKICSALERRKCCNVQKPSAASEGLTQNPLRVWEGLKTLKPSLFVGPSVIDIVCCVSQVQRLAESRPWLCTKG